MFQWEICFPDNWEKSFRFDESCSSGLSKGVEETTKITPILHIRAMIPSRCGFNGSAEDAQAER